MKRIGVEKHPPIPFSNKELDRYESPVASESSVSRQRSARVTPALGCVALGCVALGHVGARSALRRRLKSGAEGDRTPDLMTASHALSQLSYGPLDWVVGFWESGL